MRHAGLRRSFSGCVKMSRRCFQRSVMLCCWRIISSTCLRGSLWRRDRSFVLRSIGIFARNSTGRRCWNTLMLIRRGFRRSGNRANSSARCARKSPKNSDYRRQLLYRPVVLIRQPVRSALAIFVPAFCQKILARRWRFACQRQSLPMIRTDRCPSTILRCRIPT